MPAVKKQTITTTTTTEKIVDADGRVFIIDRNRNTQIHDEILTDKDIKKQNLEWIEKDKLHREEIEREQEQPNLIKLAEAGEQFALNNIVALHRDETAGEFQVKSIWWEMMLNFLKDKALAFIVGALRGLVKDQIPNMLKFADWLIEKLEDVILNQWKSAKDDETKGIIKNELNQYPQFKRLVEKMN